MLTLFLLTVDAAEHSLEMSAVIDSMLPPLLLPPPLLPPLMLPPLPGLGRKRRNQGGGGLYPVDAHAD